MCVMCLEIQVPGTRIVFQAFIHELVKKKKQSYNPTSRNGYIFRADLISHGRDDLFNRSFFFMCCLVLYMPQCCHL